MARVVCVHGIGKQQSGAELLRAEWGRALRSGLLLARAGDVPTEDEIGFAFYGDLFRPEGRRLAVGDPMFTTDDVAPGFEQDLLAALWREAARVDGRVVPPDARTLARTPGSVQAGLRALSRSAFFADVALRALVFDLKQVARYLTDPALRGDAIERVWDAVAPDTEVVVAHSLGSVVAYEALCTMRGHRVGAFVTLGSPLGIPNLIYERLRPEPGAWPGGADLAWANIADAADVVALVKDLRPAFGTRVANYEVYNGAHAHDAVSYLTDAHTGAAIAGGLRAR